MSRVLGFKHALRSLLGRPAADRDTADEIAYHVELQTRKHMANGLSPEAARTQALVEFGGAMRWREATADTRRGRWLETVAQDARYATRSLRRQPGFTAVTLLTLALGVGAITTALTVLDQLLLRPLPYPESDQLFAISEVAESEEQPLPFSIPNLADMRATTRGFASIGSVIPTALSLGVGENEAVGVSGGWVDAEFFGTLRMPALVGRLITPDDLRPDAPSVVAISERVWREHFRADPTIIGRAIRLGGRKYTAIGVLPKSFDLPAGAVFWLPCKWCVGMGEGARASISATVVGRLAPGVTEAQALADVRRAAAIIHRDHPDPKQNQMRSAMIRPLKEKVLGESERIVLMLGGAVAFVLLIACANLASANLARSSARRQELSLRVALGAGRGRLVQQLVVESGLLVTVGGALGLLGAVGALRVIAWQWAALLPRLGEVRLDGRTVLFAVAASIVVTLLTGLLPAQHFVRRQARVGVDGARGQVGSPMRIRHVLIGFEVALSMVLLAGAGIALRSLWMVLHEPVGVASPESIVSFVPELPRRNANAVAFHDLLLHRIRELPGIRGAAVASAPPLGSAWIGFIELEGNADRNPTADVAPSAGYNLVSEDYFATVQVPLLTGRVFQPTDDSTHLAVTIVTETMAKTYWPNMDPLGKRFRALSMGDGHEQEWLTVIGVVGDVHYFSLENDNIPMHYVSLRQRPARAAEGTVVVRAAGDASAAIPGIRAALRDVAPTAMAKMTTIDQQVETTTRERRITVNLFSGFAITSLLLVAIGIYGVLSYLVTLRTREIGVRMALGSTRYGVVGLMIGDMMLPVLLGLGAGIVGSLLLAKVFASLVFKISPMDPLALGATSMLLLLLAVTAALIPARRAARVDPLVALRAD